MQRFVLACVQGDFFTPTVVDVAELTADGPAFRLACEELAQHQLKTHGDPGDAWTFGAVEARGGSGAIWVTEVQGEEP